MKRFLSLFTAIGFLSILLFSGCESQQSNATSKAQTASVKTVKVNIDGMTCESCVGTVDEALTHTNGVMKKAVKLDEHCADVEYDASKTDAKTIVAAIEKTGYKARLAE